MIKIKNTERKLENKGTRKVFPIFIFFCKKIIMEKNRKDKNKKKQRN
mgnify:CR=1 FL=1